MSLGFWRWLSTVRPSKGSGFPTAMVVERTGMWVSVRQWCCKRECGRLTKGLSRRSSRREVAEIPGRMGRPLWFGCGVASARLWP